MTKHYTLGGACRPRGVNLEVVVITTMDRMTMRLILVIMIRWLLWSTFWRRNLQGGNIGWVPFSPAWVRVRVRVSLKRFYWYSNMAILVMEISFFNRWHSSMLMMIMLLMTMRMRIMITLMWTRPRTLRQVPSPPAFCPTPIAASTTEPNIRRDL